MKITENKIRRFSAWLTAGEKSAATIEKYTREALRFSQWLAGREPGRALARAYKETLVRSPAGVNGAVAALNCLFSFLGLPECRLKSVKIQRQIFRDESRELSQAEYRRLLAAAKSARNERLLLVMETITDATGELTVSGAGAESVTVENTAEPAEGEDEDAKDEETEGSEEDAKGEENTETPDAGMDVPFVPPVDPDEGGDSEEPEEPEQPEQPGSAPKITWGNVECAAGESVDVTASAVEAKDAGYWVKFSIANPDAEKYEMVVKVNNTEVTLDSNFYWFDVTSLVTAATTEAVEQFIADETKVEYKEDTENPENSAWSIKEGVTAPASVKVESQTPTTVTVTLTEKTTEENPDDVTKEADGEYTYTFELSVDATVEKDLTEDVNTALAEKKAPDPAPGADE